MRSVLINTHMLEAAHRHGVSKYFFSSSACVYPGYVQNNETAKKGKGLKESDAYPADPEDGYGWEKLFSERMCQHYYEERNQEVRVGRYHNVFGHMGTWTGGREKAPAAVCRKVALAAITGQYEIEIWGDGEQTRSFMYIDDCIEGTMRLMNSDIREPINIGSSELVSINQLVTVVEEIAGVKLERKYNLSAPQGVRGRNSDNTKIKELLDWEPSIKLSDGLERTYSWIHDQVMAERTK
jgi:nucleoside-diphosphate-sugar epimerase